MINKVFKTILIMVLCLGITLPANAAGVDVSDGSAFITKSELSYQLNNLSARMSALENSLDTQIDKLVSSYLTRNGIWNGSRQTLIRTACNTPYSRRKYDGSYDSAGNDRFPGPNKYERWEYTIVNSCNKTGMVYLRFFHEYDFDGASELKGLGDNMGYIGVAFAVEPWSGTDKTNSVGNRWGWHSFYYMNMGHSGYSSACTFFVSKGQKIYCYTYHYTSPSNHTPDGVAQCYLYVSTMNIKEILIY